MVFFRGLLIVAIYLCSTSHAIAQYDKYQQALIDSADTAFSSRNYQDALDLWRKALDTIKLEEEDALVQAHVHNVMGICFYYTSQPDSALVYLNTAYDALRDRLDGEEECMKAASIMGNISAVSSTLIYSEKSLMLAKESLRLRKKCAGKEFPMMVANSYIAVGDGFNRLYEPDSSVLYFDQALRIINELPGGEKKDEMRGRTLVKLAVAMDFLGNYRSSRDSVIVALTLLENSMGPLYEESLKARRVLANNYLKSGEIANAIATQKRAIDLLQGVTTPEYYKLYKAQALTGLANIYLDIRNYREALELLVLANNTLPTAYSGVSRGDLFDDLTFCYRRMGAFKRSTGANKIASAFWEKTMPDDHPKLGKSFSNMAMTLILTGDYAAGHDNFLKAKDIFLKKLPGRSQDMITFRTLYARNCIRIGNLEEALYEINQGLHFAEELIEEAPELTLSLKYLLVNHSLALGEIEQARILLNKAIEFHDEHLKGDKRYEERKIVELGEFARSIGDVDAFETVVNNYRKLKDMDGDFGWKKIENPIDYLIWCVKGYEFLVALNSRKPSSQVASLIKSFDVDIKKGLSFFRVKDVLNFKLLECERVVNAANAKLHYSMAGSMNNTKELGSALISADLCHSRKLASALRAAELDGEFYLPAEIQQRGSEIMVELTKLNVLKHELTLDNLKNKDSTLHEIYLKEDKLYAKKEKWIAELRNTYPNYYAARFAEPEWTISEARQELLSPNQAVVSYLVSDSSTFIFLLRTDTLIVREVAVPRKLLDRTVSSFVAYGINGYHGAGLAQQTEGLLQETINTLNRDGEQLYDFLIAPIEEYLPKKITIIPDGTLANLPFAALLSGPPKKAGKWAAYPFLGRTHIINYGFSIHQQLRMQRTRTSGKGWVGFAPFATESQDSIKPDDARRSLLNNPLRPLTPLKESGPEITAIKALTGGETFVRKQAQRKAFITSAKQAKAIHLATHGVADYQIPQDAFLAFASSDSSSYDPLRAGEIYALEAPVEMVVLSACESGVGRLLVGEGQQSLERAFAYAGARSLVSSLWPVNDGRTSDLMVEMYRALRTGMGRAEALQQAMQKVYLSDIYGAQHPYYWAGWMIRGADGPLGFKRVH